MPKVSIVIPVYKVEKYIERCVRSLFEQTLDSLEYIFVDDCSPDSSIDIMLRILEEYPSRKEQVKLIRHKQNQGVGAARTHGVAACTGDYIIHCDPDDWVDLAMYEKMYLKAKENNADMVFCDYFIVNKKRRIHRRESLNIDAINPKELIDAILQGRIHGSMCNKLYCKQRIFNAGVSVDSDIQMCEDVLFNIKFLMNAGKIFYLNQPLYFYRMHEESITSHRTDQCFKNDLCVLERLNYLLSGTENAAAVEYFKNRICSDLIIFRRSISLDIVQLIKQYDMSYHGLKGYRKYITYTFLKRCIIGVWLLEFISYVKRRFL